MDNAVFVKQFLITSSGHSNAVRKAGQIWPLQMNKLKHAALGTGAGRGGEQRKDGGRVSRDEEQRVSSGKTVRRGPGEAGSPAVLRKVRGLGRVSFCVPGLGSGAVSCRHAGTSRF